MIFCVIPKELEAELYDKLCDHYRDNPNVQVIIERRQGEDRRRSSGGGGQRITRERRRRRLPGTFLSTDPPEAA
jgi:hypothetical protein